MFDIVIAGGGPGGITAAIYARRAGLSVLLLERLGVGGQAAATYEIENVPGFQTITGAELSAAMEKHAREAGAEIAYEQVTGFSLEGAVKRTITSRGSYESRCVVLAMGAERRKLGIDGEDTFAGRGVSYCATCDGNFFRKKTVAVVGGGNTALEDAAYLSNLCEKIYLVHRRNEYRGERAAQAAVAVAANIEPVLGTVAERIEGETTVQGLRVRGASGGEARLLPVSGVFVAVGTMPRTDLLSGAVRLTGDGYVDAGESCETNIPGVYAVGDLRRRPLRQIVCAEADGAVAAALARQYIQSKGE